jgi:hypothetical protein
MIKDFSQIGNGKLINVMNYINDEQNFIEKIMFTKLEQDLFINNKITMKQYKVLKDIKE